MHRNRPASFNTLDVRKAARVAWGVNRYILFPIARTCLIKAFCTMNTILSFCCCYCSLFCVCVCFCVPMCVGTCVCVEGVWTCVCICMEITGWRQVYSSIVSFTITECLVHLKIPIFFLKKSLLSLFSRRFSKYAAAKAGIFSGCSLRISRVSPSRRFPNPCGIR